MTAIVNIKDVKQCISFGEINNENIMFISRTQVNLYGN